jgi:hypothetical protein
VQLDERKVCKQLYEAFRGRIQGELGQDVARSFHKWLVNYRADASSLYQILPLLAPKNALPTFEDVRQGIFYARTKDRFSVKIKTVCFAEDFDFLQAGYVVQVFLDLMQDYLPLGSVVDLQAEPLKDIFAVDKIENLRFVIAQRFCPIPETKLFYPYGAFVYPVGTLHDQQTLYFTPPLIKRVVHRGYRDELEQAYVLAMKDDFVLKRRYQSAGLASPQQRALMQEANR